MATEDHRVRIILEALDRGSSNLRKFFQGVDKDVQKFRKDLRDVNKEANLVFTGSGLRGRGASGQFLPIGDVEKAILKLRELKEEAKGLSRETSFGQFFTGLSQGRKEQEAIRKAFRDRVELSKEAAQKEREELDKQRQVARRDLDELFFQERQSLEANEILERKIEDAARIRKLRDLANYHEDRIQAIRKAAVREGLVVTESDIKADREAAQSFRARILRLEEERNAFIRAERDKQRAAQQTRRQEFDAETAALRRQITRPDVAEIFRKTREEIAATEKEVDRLDSRISRFGRNVGTSWSRFRTAVAIGRQELSDADRDFLKTEGRLTRLGVAFGAATRGASSFVNVRWAIIISFLQVFLTLVIQLGLALVALASSLLQAAAALGGAFLAGLTQVVPVVGLLAAAFSRLSAVLDAANLAEKLRLTKAEDQKNRLDSIAQATDRLTDARYALKRAAEAVSDSEFNLMQAGEAVKDAFKNQADAIEALAEARRQAARDIVDANLEEREAALALEEAELAVLEAKQRLREENERGQLTAQNIEDARAQVKEAQDRLAQARAEGDEAEITLALQQLNQAQQSLQEIQNQAQETQNNVKQAQIDIEQAELQREQAVIRNKRAQEDAAEARRKGIAGSERVQRAEENLAQATKQIAQAQRQQVLAQRALRDSIHGLAIAKREEQRAEEALTESQRKQTAQQEQLQQQLADLSPAERELFRSIRKLQEVYRKGFRPITDIIVRSFSNAVERAIILLQDPRILGAAQELARSIASAIDVLSEFAVTPEFRNFLIFTINNAARNVPKITDAFIDLFRVLIRISTTATPLFNNLLDRFERFASRLEERTRNTSGLEKFFGTAGRHLDSWIRFAGAVGRILGLVIKLSAPTGQTLIDSLTNKLDEWSDWLDENETRVLVFFENIGVTVSALAATLGQALKVLFEAFTSEEQTALTQFILETLLPSFTLFLQILGKLAQAFIFLTEIPLLGNLIQFAATLLIVEKLFNRLIPATQKLTNLFITFTRIIGGAALRNLALFINNWQGFFALTRSGTPRLVALQAAFPRIAAGIQLVSKALLALRVASIGALLTPPVGFVVLIAAVIAALVLLELKFHVISDAIKSLENVFRSIANFFTTHWKTVVLAAILAPFSPFLAGAVFLVRFRKEIIGAAETVINFFRNNWKTIGLIILSPFGFIAIRTIRKFGDDVVKIIRNTIEDIIEFFRRLPSTVESFLSRIPTIFVDLIRDAYEFGQDLIQGIIDGVESKATELKDTFVKLIKDGWEFVKDALGIDSPSRYTREQIGIPLAEGIREGAIEGLTGFGSEIGLVLRNELRGLETEANNIKNRMLSSLGGLQSLVSQQIGTRLDQLTPAERELQRLDRQELERGRQTEVSDAAKTVNENKKAVEKANKELLRAQKAFENAKTAERKKAAKEDLRAARLALSDAKRQLEDSLKQQAETERRINLDRRRERLQDLAAEQREQLQKSVEAEQRRADGMFRALRTALKNKDWKSVQNIFDQIVDLVGIENLGKASADAYVDGLVRQLKNRQKDIDQAVTVQQKAIQEKAKKEEIAGNVLSQAGGGSSSQAVRIREGRQRGQTDREILISLLKSGTIDLDLAYAILKQVDDATDLAILRRLFSNLGVTLKPKDVLKGRTAEQYIRSFLKNHPNQNEALAAFAKAVSSLQLFQAGGTVKGGEGSPVPIIAHAGEWVLNKAQQAKLAQSLGMGIEQIKMWLFGTNMGQGKPGPQTTGTKPTNREQGFRGAFFNLVPQVDPDGVVVWFIEMDDGAFGQVSPRDARRIKASNGTWIPGYVKRSTHGFTQRFLPPQLGRGLAAGGVVQKFLKGGIVMPGFAGPMLQSFAQGGTVLQQGGFASSSTINTKNINQHFEVRTEGETDWNYILRLGAIHAQAGYT